MTTLHFTYRCEQPSCPDAGWTIQVPVKTMDGTNGRFYQHPHPIHATCMAEPRIIRVQRDGVDVTHGVPNKIQPSLKPVYVDPVGTEASRDSIKVGDFVDVRIDGKTHRGILRPRDRGGVQVDVL